MDLQEAIRRIAEVERARQDETWSIPDGLMDALVASIPPTAKLQPLLHEFAVRCAERAVQCAREAGKEPDPRSLAAIEAKRRWLRGEASDKELTDALSDALAVANASDWGLARHVAEAAASAADTVADRAAIEAASAAANTCDWQAERKWQTRELLRMLMAVVVVTETE